MRRTKRQRGGLSLKGLGGLKGKFGNTGKFLSSPGAAKGVMGSLPGGLGSTFSGIQSKFTNLGKFAQSPAAFAGSMGEPPTNLAISAPQMAAAAMPVPSAPPMNAAQLPVPNSNIPSNLKQKYPNLKCFYLATDGKYYPVENLAKFGPQAGGSRKRTRRTKRRSH